METFNYGKMLMNYTFYGMGGLNMILVLGKNSFVEEYIKKLGLNLRNDLVYYPGWADHYTDYPLLITQIKKDNPLAVTSQNIEFIDYMLNSDLKFDVVTVFDDQKMRKLTKETAKEVYEIMGLELRG